MACTSCYSNGNRIVSVTAKCSDLCVISFKDKQQQGYVPLDLGIGGGDYVEITFCLDCGKIQGTFPLPISDIEHP